MPAAEFDLPAGHLDAPGLPAVRFPETGRPEADVLDDVRGRFDEDRFEPDKNFSITYSGIPSAISREVEALARGRFFVEWARETELGTWSMEREAVAMMASLLGGDGDAGGFITTGGTESNLAAMRLARNTGRQAEPEIIAPVTMHFSFRLGAELMGIRLVEIDVDDETYLPRIEDVERAITPRTVGLVCSAPGGSFGVLDPVEAFADLARRKGLYLHVDARVRRVHPAVHARPRARDPAVRPVARRRQLDLDRRPQAGPAADRDRLLPGQGRGHPRGDPDRADADPHDVVDEAGQPGGGRVGHARHLGREGYVRSTAHVLGLADIIAEGVTAIPGMTLAAPRFISIVGFTSSSIDLEVVHRLLAEDGWGQGYGVTRGKPFIRLSIHPSRDVEHAHGVRGGVRGRRRPNPTRLRRPPCSACSATRTA